MQYPLTGSMYVPIRYLFGLISVLVDLTAHDSPVRHVQSFAMLSNEGSHVFHTPVRILQGMWSHVVFSRVSQFTCVVHPRDQHTRDRFKSHISMQGADC